MTGRTLVLAKMDLREMEQFVLVNYNLENICACGLFSIDIYLFIYLFIAFLLLVLQETY